MRRSLVHGWNQGGFHQLAMRWRDRLQFREDGRRKPAHPIPHLKIEMRGTRHLTRTITAD